MNKFPEKITFITDGCIIALDVIIEKDGREKLKEPLAVYKYVDNGRERIGIRSGEVYRSTKIGMEIRLTNLQIEKMKSQQIVVTD